ncbi:Proline-rich receptor-like protein kinase PERK15 [Cardamine amara subsp. amara]|uniref:non-specific serine/threonine protein kinase n=1 Tax=Cardamine amara subsp. amara TaxID=228776 RepID=A0ABD1BAM6_CARAN
MFTYEDLANATDNFSNTNLIGQGGFGYVHRGLLPDGTEVAIKQLKAGSGQGEQEFQAEIHIVTRVHHRHLLSMIGYCITGSKRLLVYEFVPNKNLEFHLHEKGRPVMEWPKRMKIALGVAKGLSYLHEDCNPKTIHRDVKAANILIDDSYEAKAKPLLQQALHGGSFEGLVDPRLYNEFDISEMNRMVACAAASVHYSAKRRPKMSQIVRAFEGNLSLDDITQGVTVEHRTIYSLDGSSGYSSTQYTNDLKKFKKIALESQTFGSSGLTSDNGHYLSGSSTTTDDAIGQRTMHEIEPEKNTNETRASNRGFLV